MAATVTARAAARTAAARLCPPVYDAVSPVQFVPAPVFDRVAPPAAQAAVFRLCLSLNDPKAAAVAAEADAGRPARHVASQSPPVGRRPATRVSRYV